MPAIPTFQSRHRLDPIGLFRGLKFAASHVQPQTFLKVSCTCVLRLTQHDYQPKLAIGNIALSIVSSLGYFRDQANFEIH